MARRHAKCHLPAGSLLLSPVLASPPLAAQEMPRNAPSIAHLLQFRHTETLRLLSANSCE